MKDGPGKQLSRRDFDAVIRRAAELAASDSDPAEPSLSEAELYRIAGEVGLGERHVRRALVEVQSGHTGTGPLDRVFGPALVHASRVVRGAPRDLADKLDEFFVATQLLQPVRRGASVLQYRPAVDWTSQLARAASFTSRKYFVASAKSVEVHLEGVDDERTRVELVVDPGTRGDSIAGTTVGGLAGGAGSGFGAAFIVGGIAPLGLAIGIGVLAGGAVAAGIAYAGGQGHKKKLVEVRAEMEDILDRLEMGESLEPPPASWRRWVKRQFHGVARDLMSTEQKEFDDLDGGRRS